MNNSGSSSAPAAQPQSSTVLYEYIKLLKDYNENITMYQNNFQNNIRYFRSLVNNNSLIQSPATASRHQQQQTQSVPPSYLDSSEPPPLIPTHILRNLQSRTQNNITDNFLRDFLISSIQAAPQAQQQRNNNFVFRNTAEDGNTPTPPTTGGGGAAGADDNDDEDQEEENITISYTLYPVMSSAMSSAISSASSSAPSSRYRHYNDDNDNDNDNDLIPITPQTEIYKNNITETTYTQQENQDTLCPISHENFIEQEEIIKINHCGHIFKKNSIYQWFNIKFVCPKCNHNIFNSQSLASHPLTT
jgi:hypothetical protein